MKVTIKYDLQFDDGKREVVDVSFDAERLVLDTPPPQSLPDWTALGFHQCRNCPLNADSDGRCPVAVRLVDIADRFGATPSHQETTLHVRTPERVISARTTAQAALGSLIGLVMPLSGCPHLAPLAPMARFHLPLSTHEETVYRVTSMYLLSRYFRSNGSTALDDGLDGLSEIYAKIQMVNQGISARMRSSNVFAEVNSVAILDIYAQTIPIVIDDSLSDIEHLFSRERKVA
jgi:hypothetical protein